MTKSYFYCPKCKKIFIKKIIKIKNTYYEPFLLTHKHGKDTYMTQRITPDEVTFLRESKGM